MNLLKVGRQVGGQICGLHAIGWKEKRWVAELQFTDQVMKWCVHLISFVLIMFMFMFIFMMRGKA